MKTDAGCLACGAELEHADDGEVGPCEYCGKRTSGRISCDHRQWICDDCHDRNAVDIISTLCATTNSTSPMAMARLIFRHPSIEIHGPVHHFIVPAVLLTAYYNALGDSIKKLSSLAEAEACAYLAPTNVCTFQGACGAALGTGLFMSLITRPSPLSTEEYRLSNLATAGAMQMIGSTDGPRCCKRAVMLAIDATTTFLKARFGVNLDSSPTFCENQLLNEKCFGSNCPYHPIVS